MNIIIALLIFSLIVVIHELGHFLLARKNGIYVTEFSIGMGPRIYSVVKNDVRYSLKLLPLGGSCMMLGEDETVEDERSFNKKSVWARISVIFAGPLFNFILAFLLSIIVISMVGVDPAKITNIQEGSPTELAGLQEGDIITKLDNTTIHFGREVMMFLQFSPLTEAPLELTYKRNGESNVVTLLPQLQEDGVYRVGFTTNLYREKTSGFGIITNSVLEVKYWIVTTVKSLGQLVTGKIKMNQMSGPVGIVNVISDTVEQSKPNGIKSVVIGLLNLSILLSANLGVMNLLPIPALDGGRLVFLALEAIRRKPIDQEKEGLVHMIGFVLLMAFMVFVLYNDIAKLF